MDQSELNAINQIENTKHRHKLYRTAIKQLNYKHLLLMRNRHKILLRDSSLPQVYKDLLAALHSLSRTWDPRRSPWNTGPPPNQILDLHLQVFVIWFSVCNISGGSEGGGTRNTPPGPNFLHFSWAGVAKWFTVSCLLVYGRSWVRTPVCPKPPPMLADTSLSTWMRAPSGSNFLSLEWNSRD